MRSVIAAPVTRQKHHGCRQELALICKAASWRAGTRRTSRQTRERASAVGRSRTLVGYLKTGANALTRCVAGMGEEVVHSSSHMTDADLEAIAVYLLSLKGRLQKTPRPLAATDPRMTAGHAIYEDNCAGCHTDAGTGVTQALSAPGWKPRGAVG